MKNKKQTKLKYTVAFVSIFVGLFALIFSFSVFNTNRAVGEGSSLPAVRFRFLVKQIVLHRGQVMTNIPTDKKMIALTFDDGPIGNAQFYCDTLNNHNAAATFFFVGNRFGTKYPDDAKIVSGCGSEVANHTWDHVLLSNKTSYNTWLSTFSKTDNLIYSMIQRKPYFIRARAGIYNDALKRYAYNSRQIIVNWNIDSHDSGASAATTTSEMIVKNVVNSPNLKPGAIVLMHNSNSNTTLALDSLLTELQKKGYEPVTLSELLANARN